MGQMACLAIGISDAPPLAYLPGAVNGAKAIADWAKKAGYKTKLLVDERKPIELNTVKRAINALLPFGTKTDRLIIYFAGHGLARAAGEDLWLLSKYHEDEKGISVGALKQKLERYGIEQIAIISDACRIPPSDPDSAEIYPEVLLGRGHYDRNQPLVDMLKASSRFKAAYMIQGATPADDRCIFSGVLEEALWGHHDKAFHTQRKINQKRCITSGSLADFLEKEVEHKAAFYKVELRPEINTGFRDPKDVYGTEHPAGAPALRDWPARTAPAAMGTTGGVVAGEKRGWSTARSTQPKKAPAVPADEVPMEDGDTFINFPDMMSEFMPGAGHGRASRERTPASIRPPSPEPPPAPVPTPPPAPRETPAQERARIERERQSRRKSAEKYRAAYQGEDRPTSFETRSGFSVTGAKVAGAVAGPDVIVESHGGPNRWRVRDLVATVLQRPLPLLVELKDGRWLGSAAIPEFIQTFTVDKSGAVSVVYRRIDKSDPLDRRAEERAEDAVSKLRAGIFRPDEANIHAFELREGKHRDPMLGVLAAYFYDSLGDIDSIRQMAFYYAQRGEAVPFDIAMLARIKSEHRNGRIIAQIPRVEAREPRTAFERGHRWAYESTPSIEGVVAGAFPWLRQGWQLVEDDDQPLMPVGLERVRAHLMPAPFTTLTAEGGKLLRKIIGGHK